MTFSKRLNELMRERGMTIREAARRINVSTSTIQNWRSGHVPTDFDAVRILAEALGVSFSFLLTGVDDSRPLSEPPAVAEVFLDGRVLFDGYALIKIQQLIPRGTQRRDDE